MKIFDVLIIGGGASGLMCAISINNARSVAIIDNQSTLGKKLLVTGNGKCNLTNFNINSRYYNQDASKIFSKFNVGDTLNKFEQLGLVFYSDEENRFYPYSNSARSVVDILNNEIKKLPINVFCDENVENVTKVDGYFCIKTDKNIYFSQKLVVATGGNTGKQILDEFKIKHKKFMPSLCALKTNSTKRLSGLRLSNVMVYASCNNKTKSQRGEVLFKDSGVSGIVVFNLSTLFARQNCYNGKIEIDLVPDINEYALSQLICERKKLNCKVSEMFIGFFHNEIAKEIIWRSQIDETKNIQMLTNEEIKTLCRLIKRFAFDVVGFYENNQVYSGGVLLEELDENLQSKNVNNLYFCGEICDIDGECGGFNLQWAWTSGHIVGKSL